MEGGDEEGSLSKSDDSGIATAMTREHEQTSLENKSMLGRPLFSMARTVYLKAQARPLSTRRGWGAQIQRSSELLAGESPSNLKQIGQIKDRGWKEGTRTEA